MNLADLFFARKPARSWAEQSDRDARVRLAPSFGKLEAALLSALCKTLPVLPEQPFELHRSRIKLTATSRTKTLPGMSRAR